MNIGELTATLGADATQLDKAAEKYKKLEKVATASVERINKVEKNQKGIIEEIEAHLDHLQSAQKKAFKYDDIVKYNKKIAETKYYLKEYQNAGVQSTSKVKEQASAMQKAFAGLGLKILAGVGSMALLKKGAEWLITSSDVLGDRWEVALSGMRASLSVLGEEFISFFDDITKRGDDVERGGKRWYQSILAFAGSVLMSGNNAAVIASNYSNMMIAMESATAVTEEHTRVLQQLQDAENDLIVPRAKSLLLLNEARSKGRDEQIAMDDRIALLKEAMKIENEETNKVLENQNKRVSSLTKVRESYLTTGRALQWTREMEKEYQLAVAETFNIQSKSYSLRRRAEMELRALAREKVQKEMEYQNYLADRIRLQEKERQQRLAIQNLDSNAPTDYQHHFMRMPPGPPDQYVNLQRQLASAAMMNQIFADSISPVQAHVQLVKERVNAYEGAIRSWIEAGIPQNELFKSMVEQLRALGVEYSIISTKTEDIQNIFNNLGYSISSVGDALSNTAGNWLGFVGKILSSIPSLITNINAIAAAQRAQAISGAVAGANSIPFPLNILAMGTSIAATLVGLATSIPKMAGGGVVPSGYPNDTYPALLTSGETVSPPGKLTSVKSTEGNNELYSYIMNRYIYLANKKHQDYLTRTT